MFHAFTSLRFSPASSSSLYQRNFYIDCILGSGRWKLVQLGGSFGKVSRTQSAWATLAAHGTYKNNERGDGMSILHSRQAEVWARVYAGHVPNKHGAARFRHRTKWMSYLAYVQTSHLARTCGSELTVRT